MRSIKRLLIVLSFAALIAVALPAPALEAASGARDAVCEGAGLVAGGSGCEVPAGTPSIDLTVRRALSIFSVVLGIIAVVMIMIGGVKYMTSQGDSGQVNSAKSTILYAAIGLVVVALAQIIVRFVLARFG